MHGDKLTKQQQATRRIGEPMRQHKDVLQMQASPLRRHHALTSFLRLPRLPHLTATTSQHGGRGATARHSAQLTCFGAACCPGVCALTAVQECAQAGALTRGGGPLVTGVQQQQWRRRQQDLWLRRLRPPPLVDTALRRVAA